MSRYIVNYMTDLHLEFFLTNNDITIDELAKHLTETAGDINIFGGDTAASGILFARFVAALTKYYKHGEWFFVLGNHELWDKTTSSLQNRINFYADIIEEYANSHMHLLQDNAFGFVNGEWRMYPNDLLNLKFGDLWVREPDLLIFGGIGYAAYNKNFCAQQGIYRDALNYRQEIEEGNKFLNLYNHVMEMRHGMRTIVVTHMPLEDWGAEIKDGVIYINGHTHENSQSIQNDSQIYADNQIGYECYAMPNFNYIAVKTPYVGELTNYPAGIHVISIRQLDNFEDSLPDGIVYSRDFELNLGTLYMVKRNGYYMFFLRDKFRKDIFYIVRQHGFVKATHDLQYYYENLPYFYNNIANAYSPYRNYQNKIAHDVYLFTTDGTGGNVRSTEVSLPGFGLPALTIDPADFKVYWDDTHLIQHPIKDNDVVEFLLTNTNNQCDIQLPNTEEGRVSREKNLYFGQINVAIHAVQTLLDSHMIDFWNDAFLSPEITLTQILDYLRQQIQ